MSKSIITLCETFANMEESKLNKIITLLQLLKETQPISDQPVQQLPNKDNLYYITIEPTTYNNRVAKRWADRKYNVTFINQNFIAIFVTDGSDKVDINKFLDGYVECPLNSMHLSYYPGEPLHFKREHGTYENIDKNVCNQMIKDFRQFLFNCCNIKLDYNKIDDEVYYPSK